MLNTERIRALNDAFRTTLQGGKIMLTSGVDALPMMTKGEIVRQLRTFNKFDLANDPHGEHDFGAFEVNEDKFFWKIDYYGMTLDEGSEDPSDPAKTTRVLTVMLAGEY